MAWGSLDDGRARQAQDQVPCHLSAPSISLFTAHYHSTHPIRHQNPTFVFIRPAGTNKDRAGGRGLRR